MKKLYLMLLFFIIINCSSNEGVYWCGDHPCINEKERKAYFRETMIVEIRQIDKKKDSYSEMEKITEQARINEKKRIRNKIRLSNKNKYNKGMLLFKK